jgi:hypothetical protein
MLPTFWFQSFRPVQATAFCSSRRIKSLQPEGGPWKMRWSRMRSSGRLLALPENETGSETSALTSSSIRGSSRAASSLACGACVRANAGALGTRAARRLGTHGKEPDKPRPDPVPLKIQDPVSQVRGWIRDLRLRRSPSPFGLSSAKNSFRRGLWLRMHSTVPAHGRMNSRQHRPMLPS